MEEYIKIQTVFKRDMETKFKRIIEGDWTLPEFEYLANNKWIFTEKVDGTNIRVIFKDGKFEFKGKTDNAQTPFSLISALDAIFSPKLELFAEKFPDGVCLYGEGYGAKIQSGGKYRPDNSFVLFDAKIGDVWLRRSSLDEIAASLGLEIVPVIGEGTLYDMINIVCNGFNSTWGNFQAEGIVARPEVELMDRLGHRIITKLKCKDFN